MTAHPIPIHTPNDHTLITALHHIRDSHNHAHAVHIAKTVLAEIHPSHMIDELGPGPLTLAQQYALGTAAAAGLLSGATRIEASLEDDQP